MAERIAVMPSMERIYPRVFVTKSNGWWVANCRDYGMSDRHFRSWEDAMNWCAWQIGRGK